MKDNRRQRKCILIVNVNWLGDVLFSTASIKAIRKAYPDSYIACLVVPRCREILEDNIRLSEIIIYDENGKHRSLIGKIKFILLLRSRHFDTVFLFHRSFTRALMCFLAGIPERVGYWRKKGGFLLSQKVEVPPPEIHRADYFLNLVNKAGIETHEKNCEFFVSDEAKKRVSDLLKKENIEKSDLLIAINPGGNWELKRWPGDRFASLSDKLIERYKAKVIITGAETDINLAQTIKEKMNHEVIIACGRTNLKELASLFKFSDLVISADTGPLHIAISMQTPVVALFGPTSPKITGPFTSNTPYVLIQKDVGCAIPCYNLDCQDKRCMKAITVDDVLEAVNKLISYPFTKKNENNR